MGGLNKLMKKCIKKKSTFPTSVCPKFKRNDVHPAELWKKEAFYTHGYSDFGAQGYADFCHPSIANFLTQ